MGGMSSAEQFRTLEAVSDHGFGTLGQLARGVLTEYVAATPPVPRLHLGHNTLPNPPSPVVGHIAFPVVEGAWQRCGQHLFAFLASAARSLREQPKPPGSVFSEQHRTLQRLLRIDSIAMVWEVRMLLPTESVAGWTLAADVLAGRVGRQDLDASVAEPALAVWAADRAGAALLMWAPAGGTAEDIACDEDLLDADDPIVAHLTDVLDAQYAWTSAVFGTDR
jgi:hypothetical protein